MKKTLIPLTFILITSFAFSQDYKPSLTDSQKAELRKQHNSSLSFKSNNGAKKNNLNFTNSTEQSENDIKTTTVKYYYGKEDSLFKEYTYRKTETGL